MIKSVKLPGEKNSAVVLTETHHFRKIGYIMNLMTIDLEELSSNPSLETFKVIKESLSYSDAPTIMSASNSIVALAKGSSDLNIDIIQLSDLSAQRSINLDELLFGNLKPKASKTRRGGGRRNSSPSDTSSFSITSMHTDGNRIFIVLENESYEYRSKTESILVAWIDCTEDKTIVRDKRSVFESTEGLNKSTSKSENNGSEDDRDYELTFDQYIWGRYCSHVFLMIITTTLNCSLYFFNSSSKKIVCPTKFDAKKVKGLDPCKDKYLIKASVWDKKKNAVYLFANNKEGGIRKYILKFKL